VRFNAGDDKLGLENMQGSLDAPPIIIRQSRLKLGLTVLTEAALTAFCYWLFEIATHDGTVMGGVILIGLALLTIFQAWTFLNPGSLEIGPDGVLLRTGLKIARYDWADFDGFVVVYGRSIFSRYPSAVFSKDCDKQSALGALWGGASMGSQWELGATEIVNLLDKGLAKWGRHSQATKW
jgi:hypothetical protein